SRYYPVERQVVHQQPAQAVSVVQQPVIQQSVQYVQQPVQYVQQPVQD
nr:epiplasmin class 2=membrane skeleton protein [Paramecium tetraurelia, 51S derivative strain d4-2, Peptide Partial, 47 aa] [Paramecium tetraurelia]